MTTRTRGRSAWSWWPREKESHHMNMWTWSMRLRPRPTTIELTLQGPERDLLRAVLPRPAHPRALVTLLEGLALWQGAPLSVAVCVKDSSESSGLMGLGLTGET